MRDSALPGLAGAGAGQRTGQLIGQRAGLTRYDYVSDPVWSPNGRWIAFTVNEKSIHGIHPRGGRAKLIMEGPWWEPDWCPVCDLRNASFYTGELDWQPLPAEP
jgi:WD40-like Beta Propeller Repeat